MKTSTPTGASGAAAPHSRQARAVKLARGLGWFSIALGLAETLAPEFMAQATGLTGYEGVIRAYGVRELVTGAGVLLARDPTLWIWLRVAGDALDLGTLALGLGGGNALRWHTVVSLVAVAGVTMVDVSCGAVLRSNPQRGRDGKRDYSDRSGLPRPPGEMRGAAAGERRAEGLPR